MTRSRIASKILSETPELRESVKRYSKEVVDFYATIELTEDEKTEAIFQAKVAKYFRKKHDEYWRKLEEQKTKDDESKEMESYKTNAPSVQVVLQKRSKERWGKTYKAKKKRT